MKTRADDNVRKRFFAPAIRAIREAKTYRYCVEYPDENFVIAGVGRVLATAASGRDWVQQVCARMGFFVSVSSFFYALKSRRRLSLVREVAGNLRKQVDSDCGAFNDPLAKHPELDGFEIYASDGHYEEVAAHAKPVRGKKYAPGYFFSLNLRTHSMALLDIARPELKGKKREHDMSALKRLSACDLRLGAPKGTKVLHVYDPAGVDFHQWLKWKSQGIYVISREKENFRPQVVGIRDLDTNDPRNNGVLVDENIGVTPGYMARRVQYQDPATGEVFSFITTQMTFPPGLIAFLYKLRWDIEKVFDEKKNKLGEKKAWATSAVARSQQAHFVCMAHNLMLLLERHIERNEGLRDEKSLSKRRTRVEEMKKKILAAGRKPNPLVLNCTRTTQRSLQFIRWIRNAILFPSAWRAEITVLHPLMTRYLQ